MTKVKPQHTLSDEVHDQREAAVNMLSEVDFWEMELNFFDRLLRSQVLNTRSEYGD